MRTNSQRLLWTVVSCSLIVATRSVFGLGGDYPNGKPLMSPTNWPKGMESLVDTTNRVHGYFVNAEDVFFFSGDASQLTAFLRACSELEGVKSRRLILHQGAGEARSPWGKVGRPCDWKLYACPKGWRNAEILLGQHTNSIEVIQTAAREPGYLLEVHFWTGGRVALDEVHIPENIEVAGEQPGTPSAKASFGEVIERQLPAPSYIAEKQVLLDLDKGELLAMPTNIWMAGISFSPRPRFNWMVKHGADLLVHSSEVSGELDFHLDDGWLALLGTNVSFETIAASDVNELARRGVFQHLEIPRPEKGPGAALVFKTREGGLGVMQLLAFSAKPEPILKLRYKLVRHTTPIK